MTKRALRNGSLPSSHDDVRGYAVGLYTGDYGNKARPGSAPAESAAGRDPAGIVAQTGRNLVILVRAVIPSLPF